MSFMNLFLLMMVFSIFHLVKNISQLSLFYVIMHC